MVFGRDRLRHSVTARRRVAAARPLLEIESSRLSSYRGCGFPRQVLGLEKRR